MVLRMHNAQPVTRASAPELYALVQELAERAQLPLPAIYLIETDQPNAFATGRDPHHSAVAVTRGLMQSLSREELAGVIAHELAHIKNRDTLTMTIAATIAGAIGFLGNFAFFFGGIARRRAAEPDRRDPDHDPGAARRVAGADGDLAHARVLSRPARVRRSAASRAGSPVPCSGSSRRAAAGSWRRPSTTRPARTCSSSTRCAWAGSTICSAPIRRPRTGSAGCWRWSRAAAAAQPRRRYATAACRGPVPGGARGPDPTRSERSAGKPPQPGMTEWRWTQVRRHPVGFADNSSRKVGAAKDQIAAPVLAAGVQPQPTNRWKPRSVRAVPGLRSST